MTAVDTPQVNDPDLVQEDDFLAFWRTREAAAAPSTTRILGVDVVVPTDIPLRVEQRALQLEDAQEVDEIRPLLADLFGADHLDTWIAHGATSRMLQVIVAWAMANGTGTPTTFARARELADQAQMVAGTGKVPPVPNRAARRAPSGTGKSASTGRSSSPTSAASTTSRRRRSVS